MSVCRISTGCSRNGFRSDLELRAQLVMQSMDEPVGDLLDRKDKTRLKSYLSKLTADQRLLAIQVCRPHGSLVIQTERMPASITCEMTMGQDGALHRIMQLPSGSVQVSVFDSKSDREPAFKVRMVHDLSFIDRRQRSARDFLLAFLGIGAVVLALLVVIAAWWQLRKWVEVLVGDIRGAAVSRRCAFARVLDAGSVAGATRPARGRGKPAARDRLQ